MQTRKEILSILEGFQESGAGAFFRLQAKSLNNTKEKPIKRLMGIDFKPKPLSSIPEKPKTKIQKTKTARKTRIEIFSSLG
ncbi:MAG: hypothetical protein H0V01_00285 [Bacteroidetes bacterium]|nr:hypothetical protein [Bacteroidota bacterium]HET6244957.1 hypothetical protein [Bacteroidia bacterium]